MHIFATLIIITNELFEILITIFVLSRSGKCTFTSGHYWTTRTLNQFALPDYDYIHTYIHLQLYFGVYI